MKAQLFSPLSLLKVTKVEPAKAAREHAHGQQEAWTAGHPTAAVQRDAAPGHHTVQMGMRCETLPPGMQDAKETDLDTQALRIGRDRLKSFGRGPETTDRVVLPRAKPA